MANVFLCPACKATIAADEAIGEEVRCPVCSAIVVVSIDDPRPPIEVQTASSGLAVGALICAVLGVVTCMPPLGIVAIILGIKANNLAKQHPQRYDGAHFARSGIVAGIVGIITSVLIWTVGIPGLLRARELERRTICMANLRGLGSAFYIYAQDPPSTFPITGDVRVEDDGAFTAFNPLTRTNAPQPDDLPSPTVDLWTVARTVYCTPSQFICPSTQDVEDPAQDMTLYYDFLAAENLSYSYLYQHDPDRKPIGTSSEPWFPVLADANPYIKGGVTTDFAVDRTSASHGNSFNHGREGQSVLCQDGHVSFKESPDAGGWLGSTPADWWRACPGGDNIYTTHNSGGSLDPGDAAPTLVGTRGTCNLGSKSDACLIP